MEETTSGLIVAGGGVSRSSLESSAKLVRLNGGYWRLRYYTTALEATGSFVSAAPARPWTGEPWKGEDEAPSYDTSADGARRARSSIRRYCAANGLNRLGTLTYGGEGCFDGVALRSDLAAFFRKLRTEVGRPFAYLWVPEWHPGGHGLHVHFAVGRFIPVGVLRKCWPHGFVHIKLITGLAVGSGKVGEARKAGRYLAKYAGKDLDASVRGRHRYEVAQGYQPPRQQIIAATAQDGVAAVMGLLGGREPARVWFSADMPDWNRPAAMWAQWDP